VSRRVAPPSGWPPPAEATLGGVALDLEALAARVSERYFERFPGDLERYGEVARAWELHDTQYLLSWAVGDAEGFVDLERQALWLAGILKARDFPLEHLAGNLELAADVMAEHPAVAERLLAAAVSVRRSS
jgi:hypothetical protein